MPANEALWRWTRYWLASAPLSRTLISQLLPVNPPETYRTLEQLSDRRLLVLLGEPGSGKSVEIRQEHARIIEEEQAGEHVIYLDGRTTVRSERTLDRIWFDSDVWKTWRESSEDFWVFFDGFDESAQHIEGLGGIIVHELHQVLGSDNERARRLFLRIASRTTGWQSELGETLSRLIHPDDSAQLTQEQYTFHLAPPRWDDIVVAAESRNVDGRAFCERVRAQGIESLVLRPAQLDWLLNIFEAGGRLPDDKVALYWEGMRQLCQDPLQVEDAENLRSLAGRVAFVMMFGGIKGVWHNLDRGNVPPGSIPLSRFVGGVEQTSWGDEVQITQDLLCNLVQSGLFTSLDMAQAIWAHQTYPEFLAAKYAVTRGLPLSQMTGLITNPLDPSQKVLPHMLEVAAWMASINKDVFEYFLQHDPGSLVESDVALTEPEDRERLVRAFLSSMANGQLHQTRWPQKGHYSSLYFPELAVVLKPFITDKELRKDARDTAIDIAVDCGLEKLGDVLAEVALDATELEVVRRSAAWAVARMGNEQSRQRLLPLITASTEEDPFEELKGCALRANWPTRLDIHSILEHLTVPKWFGFGAYRLFLSQDFVQHLSNDDLLPALAWLGEQQDWEARSYDLDRLEAHLVSKAMERLDEPPVLDWIIRRAVAHLAEYKPLLGEGVRGDDLSQLIASPKRRQKLLGGLAEIISDTAQADTVAYMLLEHLRAHPDWVDSDFPWMVQQLQESDVASIKERFWLSLLRGTFSVTADHKLTLLYNLYSSGRFESQLADLFAPVDLWSDEAARQKRLWYVLSGMLEQDRETSGPIFNSEQQATNILTRVDGGQYDDWWQIDECLKFDERGRGQIDPSDTDIRAFPGWSRCSLPTQRRIVDAAARMIQAYKPDNRHLGTGTFLLADHAAYRALVLLKEELPQALETLSDKTWEALGPLILGMHSRATGSDVPYQRVLLERAIKHGFDPVPWLAVMASRANEGSSFYLSPALRVVSSLASDPQIDRLSEALIRPEMPISALAETLRVVGERRMSTTFERALEVIEGFAQKEDGVRTAANLASVLMDFVDPGVWSDLWELMNDNDELFDRALLDYAHWHRDAGEWARGLDETAIASLYQRLARRFPPSQDPNLGEMHVVSHRESLGRWREDLLTSLAMRGTWKAVEQLHNLKEQLPDIEWLPIRIAQAEEEARQRTWQPPSVDDLFSLARSTDARIINSPTQLHDVVLESLARLQQALSAESPAAIDLWNIRGTDRTGTPRDELLISDYIKRYLDRDIGPLGIIVNREVENRIRNEIDIYIQYVSAVSPAPITVVCEVKGCWHRDLYTSMKSQLHERYMKQQGISHGIYVVAFFDSERWETSDHERRHQTRDHSLDGLGNRMASQASELSDSLFHVSAVVLDCTY